MVDGGVVHNQVRDDPDAPIARGLRELHKITQRSISRIDAIVVANVVPVIAPRRRKEWLEPQAIDVQPGDVVQFPREPEEIADPVTVSIRERLQVDRVYDCVFVPKAFHTAPVSNRVSARLPRICPSNSAKSSLLIRRNSTGPLCDSNFSPSCCCVNQGSQSKDARRRSC